MATTVNTEVIPALDRSIAAVDELGPKLSRALENCKEIAKETGSTELMKTYDGAEESVNALSTSAKELVETLRTLSKKYKSMAQALGAM